MKLIKRRQDNQGSQSGVAPYRDINRIRNELNRIFQDPLAMLQPSGSLFGGWEPNLDVYDDKDKIT
ncbi:MAG: Hsp20/alpha crystallin family protein, partial [Limisphaerales bacterium]